jgi:hypothetical protein
VSYFKLMFFFNVFLSRFCVSVLSDYVVLVHSFLRIYPDSVSVVYIDRLLDPNVVETEACVEFQVLLV